MDKSFGAFQIPSSKRGLELYYELKIGFTQLFLCKHIFVNFEGLLCRYKEISSQWDCGLGMRHYLLLYYPSHSN